MKQIQHIIKPPHNIVFFKSIMTNCVDPLRSENILFNINFNPWVTLAKWAVGVAEHNVMFSTFLFVHISNHFLCSFFSLIKSLLHLSFALSKPTWSLWIYCKFVLANTTDPTKHEFENEMYCSARQFCNVSLKFRQCVFGVIVVFSPAWFRAKFN